MVIHKFSPLLSSFSTPFLCAAGIGRTFWHRKVVPAQTACRETYGLLLYAGVTQMVRERGLGVPFGAGKDCYCSQGVGAGDKKEWR